MQHLSTRQTSVLGGAGGRPGRKAATLAGSFSALLQPTGDSSILPTLYCPGSPAGCWSSTDTICIFSAVPACLAMQEGQESMA
jgi:hypothetical protein